MPALQDEDGIWYLPKTTDWSGKELPPSILEDIREGRASYIPRFPEEPTGLIQCRHCGDPVFRMGLRTSSWSKTDFDWRPWCIEDEQIPESLTAAQKRKWIDQRPYQLGLAVLDLKNGTYKVAVDKANQKRKPEVMYRHHWCEEKERQLYGRWQQESRTEPIRRDDRQAEAEVHLRILPKRSRRLQVPGGVRSS